MDPKTRAAEVIKILRELGLKFALVGGLAVSARTRERFTSDVDFAIAVTSDDQAEQVAFDMQSNGYRLEKVMEHAPKGYLSTIRLAHPSDPPDSTPTVDLLFASSGIEHEIVQEATLETLSPNIQIPVAQIPHLIAMKILSENKYREQDRSDLRLLLNCATKPNLKRVRELLKLIEKRGFARGKKLSNELMRFEREYLSSGY